MRRSLPRFSYTGNQAAVGPTGESIIGLTQVKNGYSESLMMMFDYKENVSGEYSRYKALEIVSL